MPLATLVSMSGKTERTTGHKIAEATAVLDCMIVSLNLSYCGMCLPGWTPGRLPVLVSKRPTLHDLRRLDETPRQLPSDRVFEEEEEETIRVSSSD